jgi:uncharacterized protein YgiB involved in biofilm formation
MSKPAPRVLRSRSVRIALLGAAAFGLSGCFEEEIDTQVFPTLGECRAAVQTGAAEFTAQDCDDAFALALVAHNETAPRYNEQALCEEQHGGECVADPAAGGSSGGIFMPLMMGYMMGSLMSNGRAAMSAQPLYRNGAGGYSTPSGATNLNNNSGSARLAPSNFRAAPATSAAQPMTRATARSTGGFGAGRTGSSGVGG